MQNKLAIVIPFYKIEFFEETLKSVASQTNKKFTLYIGNDAAPINPLSLIKKYFSIDDFNYFDYNVNWGGENLALQWERILENVTEDWFQILGDDDMIAYNFVEEFYNCLNNKIDDFNVIKFPLTVINENNIKIKDFSYDDSFISREAFLLSRLDQTSSSSLSENIFRRIQYLKYKIQKFPLAWHSDDCMIFEYAENKKILNNKKSTVLVRNSGINISSLQNNQEEKSCANNSFYNFIIEKYFIVFNSEQKKIILHFLKKHYYYSNDKPNLKLVYLITKDNLLNGLRFFKYLF
ncbi:glycosyltransferase family A protein [Halpernia frigidisoli]|uniref:Glycosyl transferase family 2 n=1 Tax=Halpernia frigidisoli TaxID=1125876 RepID=A0A1I3GL93_9FLAO|nr:glycosyltransferase family A protein [Halpernia frigidisoli]SFI24249.1 Glycosyl transferase family 2 [Halpernia frigidisoli]